MEFPLDPEQRRAVEAAGVSVLLTAGAGCGKTGTITARFMHLLGKRDAPELLASPECRVQVGRIGVLTFTNKAAAELRHRIRSACEREAEKHAALAADSERSAEAARYWQLVSFAVDGMTISTYHSFYERMVREFADMLELDPDVRLLDERIAAGLKREAARDAVRERLTTQDPVLIAYAARHRLDGVVDQLVALLGLGDHQTLVSEIAQADESAFCERWLSGWYARVDPLADRLEALLQEIVAFPATGLTSTWIGKSQAAAEALTRIEDDRYGALSAAVRALPGPYPKRPGLNELLDDLKTLKENTAFDLMQGDLKLLEQAAAETIVLARMVETARGLYEEMKRRRRAVDFDDLVVKVRELSAQGVTPRGRTGPIFEHFLVDEFQDTDRLQSVVLQALAGPSFGHGALFVVGDVKQAIYRFRGSDPEALLELRDVIPPEGHLSLASNYRSRKAIVEFVNILARSMYPDLPDDPSLASGLCTQAALAERPAAVDMLWTVPADGGGAPGAQADADLLGSETHRAEAANLAAHLRRLVDAGIPVGARRRDGEVTNARPGDIVLLSRSRSHWRIYEQALMREGFQVHQDSVGGFFRRQEVRDLVNLLAVAEYRMDDLRLAACLRGPMFAVTDETLFMLAGESFRPGQSLADRFWGEPSAGFEGISATDRAMLERARKILEELHRLKAQLPPSRVVRLAIERTGFEAIARATADEPERALANLETLVDDARSFDRDPDFGWPAMIRQWLSDLDSTSRFDEAVVDAPADRIRFLTIHAAKGLEFPVVIMPGLNSPSPQRTGPYLIHPKLGLITRSRTPDESPDGADHPAMALATLAVRDDEDREIDNLLYVAATRAMDKLILSAVFDPAATNKDGSPKTPAGPFLKRLTRAFDLNTGRPFVPGPETPPEVIVHRFEEAPAEGTTTARRGR
ncbi:AAA family ATPase [bacterium]|nr:AAA family ATPase [bacterium]